MSKKKTYMTHRIEKLVSLALLAATSLLLSPAARSELTKAEVMSISDLGSAAKGTRKADIDAAKARIAKTKSQAICPVLTDRELEAFAIDSGDFNKLWKRYSAKSHEASDLGTHTNHPVRRACEKEARRVLFAWDDSQALRKAESRYQIRFCGSSCTN